MQITREVTLKDAVEIIEGFLSHLSAGSVAVGDNEVRLEHPVTIEFEIDSTQNELQLEFEIKWKAPKSLSASSSGASPRTSSVGNDVGSSTLVVGSSATS